MIGTEKLGLFGGPKAVTGPHEDMFKWPIITEEDEAAAVQVLRDGAMSGTDITKKFEKEFAEWLGMDYALGFNNGTSSLLGAFYGCGIGVGDEVICPSVTYWASALPAYSLGASVVFAEIDPVTLCLDPNDIEHRITERTKAIVVVHYLGHPADMDPIMEVARKHNLKVIEDVSHAQGGYYKGHRVGTIGDVGAMSLMAGKSFAIGEGGILVTNDQEIYERAIAFGHYERNNQDIQTPSLQPFIGLPLGGYKFRMHQVSSAVGRVQLKYYDERIAEIDKAMNYFWDSLEGVPGLRAHRPAKNSGSTMGGWYATHGHYVPEELGGLSVTRFCEAVRAEGVGIAPGCNLPLHLHPLQHDADVYGHGKPTIIANASRDLRQPKGALPVSEGIAARVYSLPWFKHFRPELIDQYVEAFRKVATQYEALLADDKGNPEKLGGWNFFRQKV
ncbi:DegT/DnrJ/EryC1/StrS family aminotransferase [Paenibacillus ginsengarvi]|uniref:DegT/DnrJ/EryC1/StrS family aminotransferase n=1 Tax=Paenibacillus ginsengarvi TaxID=400777 RepID=A0A3B0CIR9_9BACL|nr:DegT/DnrJ/EryC1/StrS family aminotransferase [Paenibacillus ginsengarvi]RKN84199.1 DegT/DnrJ/EryC1/StrS family aminotransferase [Paenibacillus ginsengarvi]